MTTRRVTTFRIEQELLDALAEIRDREGVPIPEQVRRGIRMWLEAKGVKKADRKRAGTRKRS
jgi:hypothetical protein